MLEHMVVRHDQNKQSPTEQIWLVAGGFNPFEKYQSKWELSCHHLEIQSYIIPTSSHQTSMWKYLLVVSLVFDRYLEVQDT